MQPRNLINILQTHYNVESDCASQALENPNQLERIFENMQLCYESKSDGGFATSADPKKIVEWLKSLGFIIQQAKFKTTLEDSTQVVTITNFVNTELKELLGEIIATAYFELFEKKSIRPEIIKLLNLDNYINYHGEATTKRNLISAYIFHILTSLIEDFKKNHPELRSSATNVGQAYMKLCQEGYVKALIQAIGKHIENYALTSHSMSTQLEHVATYNFDVSEESDDEINQLLTDFGTNLRKHTWLKNSIMMNSEHVISLEFNDCYSNCNKDFLTVMQLIKEYQTIAASLEDETGKKSNLTKLFNDIKNVILKEAEQYKAVSVFEVSPLPRTNRRVF